MEMGLPLFYALSILLYLASVAFAENTSPALCSSKSNKPGSYDRYDARLEPSDSHKIGANLIHTNIEVVHMNLNANRRLRPKIRLNSVQCPLDAPSSVSQQVFRSQAGTNYVRINDSKCNSNSSSLHLTLYHPRNPRSPASISDVPISTILSHDEARVKSLALRLSKIPSSRPTSLNRHFDTKSVSDPLTPGGSVGLGNYVTQVGIGTPATSYVMVVDTGSSLSWMQCRPCTVSCHAQVGTVFNPKSSNTYRAITCSATECTSLRSATLNPSSCSKNVCIYQASYGDSSFSVGYLSKDTLSLGSHFAFPNFTYGCGQDNEGLFGKSAGLIGLARNKLSLLSQLAPKLGYAFSYCLPTTKSTGFLSVGSYNNPAGFSYTPLVSSSLDDALYFLKLAYISVAGKPIAVPASAYGSIPTIIDSGTVITRLQSDVYTALSKAFLATMRGHKRADAYSILDTCFEGKVASTAVAAVALVFDGGATMKLRPENIMISLNNGKLMCLAFSPATSVSIIGNTQQQTFKVVYDVAGKRVGFAASGCR